jgi:hypothetical protein
MTDSDKQPSEQHTTSASERLDYLVREYGLTVIGVMLAENARDVTDAEIDRTLSRCVGANMLIPVAKRMRELGTLVLDADALRAADWPEPPGGPGAAAVAEVAGSAA